VFGEPMSFWQRQMPAGMCLRSNWGASHIADPEGTLTLDAYSRQSSDTISKPIPLEKFVDYGLWYQRTAVPEVDRRQVRTVETNGNGFQLLLDDGGTFRCRSLVIAVGISAFAARPPEFASISPTLASHTTEQGDLRRFSGQKVAVIGGGQSALESAALLKEAGSQVQVIARAKTLNWVGLHPRLHHLGPISRVLYSTRDVGPAGISRIVAMPHVFRRFPRSFQDRTAYRAIRPAGASWLQSRIDGVPITLGRSVVSAEVCKGGLRITLDDRSEQLVDHALLATGFRVDVSQYSFLPAALLAQLRTASGFPVLKPGLESSIPGLYFVGKPAAWSFGPLLGFVSGAEFASNEVTKSIARNIRIR
jgi:NAD(P)H-nitrite reductase large subunit